MAEAALTVYGASWCTDCRRAKKFLGEQRVHYHWVDIEQDAEGQALVERMNGGKRIIPTIVFDDGSFLVEPSNAELAKKLHLQTQARMHYYKGAEVMVIGGGNSAGEESLFLTRFASHVTILMRGSEMTASKLVSDKVQENPQITLRPNAEVVAFQGAGKLTGVVVRDRTTSKTETLHPKGVFVFIGLQPNTEWLPPEIMRDDQQFIATDPTLQTSVPGIFAAGDVRAGSIKQAASAAGEGATAALMIREYLKTV